MGLRLIQWGSYVLKFSLPHILRYIGGGLSELPSLCLPEGFLSLLPRTTRHESMVWRSPCHHGFMPQLAQQCSLVFDSILLAAFFPTVTRNSPIYYSHNLIFPFSTGAAFLKMCVLYQGGWQVEWESSEGKTLHKPPSLQ